MWEIAVALLVVLLAVIIYIGYTSSGANNASCGCGGNDDCDRCKKSKCGGCDMPRRRCRCKKDGCQFC